MCTVRGTGVERLNETSGGLSNGRVRKRHVQVIRPPKMFVTDVASCAWLSKQMDPNNTVLVSKCGNADCSQCRCSFKVGQTATHSLH